MDTRYVFRFSKYIALENILVAALTPYFGGFFKGNYIDFTFTPSPQLFHTSIFNFSSVCPFS